MGCSMSSRERVIRAIEFTNPDRVPKEMIQTFGRYGGGLIGGGEVGPDVPLRNVEAMGRAYLKYGGRIVAQAAQKRVLERK